MMLGSPLGRGHRMYEDQLSLFAPPTDPVKPEVPAYTGPPDLRNVEINVVFTPDEDGRYSVNEAEGGLPLAIMDIHVMPEVIGWEPSYCNNNEIQVICTEAYDLSKADFILNGSYLTLVLDRPGLYRARVSQPQRSMIISGEY